MKKLKKISYLYFLTAILISLYSLVSQNKQVLNIDDTYYVVSANDFALIVIFIYSIIGVCLFTIDKYVGYRIKIFQYLMFNIPFIYYIFSDLTNHHNPGYYLAHPIAFKWEVVYIPVILIFTFLASLLIFIGLVIFTVFKIIKKNKSNS